MKKAFWLILAGIAIGILIAPDKGTETWKKITDRLGDLKDRARNNLDDLSSKGKNMAEKAIVGLQEVSEEW